MRLLFTLICFWLASASVVLAASGDTIMVKAHQDVEIRTNPSVGSTSYPVWASFPDATTPYYKVYAYLTFECADGLRCGEWDYLNYLKLGRTGGVNGNNWNWELARYITPYGFYWDSSMKWKHGWYFDMTDYAGILRDSVEIIYQHTGYEANNDRGWKINLSFFVVEGEPVRDPVQISRLWSGSFQYGNPNNPIEANLQPQTVTLHNDTRTANLKIIQTGHGMDATENCAEFCPKQRTVKWNNSVIDQRFIWKEDCGFNSLFPQAGTWLYDRTNWCPGEPVPAHDLHLLNLTGGSQHTFDIDMQSYTSSGNFGNYVFTTYLVEYGELNRQVDVELETVIAPSTEFVYERYNPICDQPVIVIHNNGSEALTSLDIEYGVPGNGSRTMQWTGNLAFDERDTVTLTEPIWWGGGADALEFHLRNPNGKEDQFAANNSRVVPVQEVPVMGDMLIVFLFTNKAASENYYYVRDLRNDSIVYAKTSLANSTLYRDTVYLNEGGCYQFEFYDDGNPPANYPLNEDGLGWWANSNDGTGTLRLLSNAGSENFGPDFGTKILHQFRVLHPLSVESPEQSSFEVYPNPSAGVFHISCERIEADTRLEVIDRQGRVVAQTSGLQGAQVWSVDLSGQPAGMYLVRMISEDGVVTQKIVKL